MVARPPERMTIPFAEYGRRVEDHITRVYGVGVITRDVPDPLTGDLDGADIHIDYELAPHERLFLLAHLFGHTVQWNLDPSAFALGQPRPVPVDPAMLPALLEYEREAAGYSLAMLHNAGLGDLDQWLADYSACDLAYLAHFYTTGEKRGFHSFWRCDTPLIAPKPVPAFTPRRLTFRADGIVI